MDRWSRSYSPGGRGAGNGVAARSQLYERSNANRRSVPFVVRSSSFGKKTRGVGPDSKKTRRFRNFRKLRLLSLATVTVLWIGGAALFPGRPWSLQWGALANKVTEDLTANGKSPLFIRFANAKLGPSPELKKSEASRNFLSFRVVWGSEYRL